MAQCRHMQAMHERAIKGTATLQPILHVCASASLTSCLDTYLQMQTCMAKRTKEDTTDECVTCTTGSDACSI